MNDIKLSIPKQDVGQLEQVVFPGVITVIDTPEAADAAVAELEKETLLGFDTETRPTFQKGHVNKVALMQISTDTKAFLFRLNKIGITPSLIRLLENADITKVGLSIRDDFCMMHRSEEFEPKSFIELQEYVRQFHIIDSSLQRIYAIVFEKRISKSQQLSNWEAPTLTPAQQSYAAIDAWACLCLYRKLKAGEFVPEESKFVVREETE
ncbi:MAG: 3'-5' exonuclease domain-containing protein 2 [Muribaculaceae bacterium]|nr:3'-5' exonuclease domain-containing protein 2 [Muribaculaceae bacterium]